MAGDADLLARAAALALSRAALARGAEVQCAWFDTRLHPPQGLGQPHDIAAFIQRQNIGDVDLPRVLSAVLLWLRSLVDQYARIEVQWLLHAQSGSEQVGAVRELARQVRGQAGCSALFLCPGAAPQEPPALAGVLAGRRAVLGSAALYDAEERALAARALRGLARPHEREQLQPEAPPRRRVPFPKAVNRSRRVQVAGARHLRTLEGHSHWLHSVAWSPDGQTLASAASDNTIHLWVVRDGTLVRRLQGHAGSVRDVAWSPDGQMLATASEDNTLRLWRAADGAILCAMEGHSHWLHSVAWSPDGQTLATASEDKTVRLWRAADGALLRTLEGHKKRVTGVAWSPDGQTLASAGGDATVRLWRVADGLPLRALEGHQGQVNSVAWSPDGQTLASAADWQDKRGLLWRVADGSVVRALEGHHKRVTCVAWSPDGQALATAASDNTVRLWRAADGALLDVLQGHSNYVVSVAWSPDGQTLASASWDLTVRLWSVEAPER
jgi:sugar lactone lactonase YvrE